MCVATRNVKNVEAFRVTVVNLLTKKAKYWGATNVAENESRNQEKLVEGMEEKHHVNLQYDEFQRARMITSIYHSYSSNFLVIFRTNMFRITIGGYYIGITIQEFDRISKFSNRVL